MAATKRYEIAAAYVRLIPTIQGIQKALTSELKGSSGLIQNQAKAIGSSIKTNIASGASGLDSIFSGAVSFGSFGAKISGSLLSSVGSAAGSLSSTLGGALSSSFKTALAGLAALAAPVVGQIAGGGLKRSLDTNAASAQLKALGYTGQRFQKIMDAASASVDGTSYSLSESMGTATQLLAGGVDASKLESTLKSVGKLADMSGDSFDDMGQIMAKNAASGVVQWEDLSQLMEHGIPIQSYLAKQMGKSVSEIRKMASAGEITFDDFSAAVNAIDFDSVLYATQNTQLAFKNLRAQLSKIGSTLWQPIIDGLAPIFVKMRGALVALQKNKEFNAFINMMVSSITIGMQKLDAVITTQTDRIQNGTSKLFGVFTKLKDFDWAGLKDKLIAFAPALAGLGVSLGGGLLSKIPVVGGLFASLEGPGGIFLGVLVSAYAASDNLQASVKNLLGWLKDLITNGFGQLSNIDGKSIFKNIGDGISSVINGVMSVIKNLMPSIGGVLGSFKKLFSNLFSSISNQVGGGVDLSGVFSSLGEGLLSGIKTVIDALSSHIGEIVPVIANIFGSIKKAFQTATENIDVGTIVNVLTTAFSAIGSVTKIIIPIIGALAGIAIGILSSNAFGSIIDWLSGVADAVASHQGVITALAATLGIWFVAKKLSGPIMAAVSFFSKTKISSNASSSIGKFLGGIIESLSTAGSAILSATPGILQGIAGIAIIATAIGGVFFLLNSIGIVDQLQQLGQAISQAFLGVVQTIADALGIFIDLLTSKAPEIAAAFSTLWPAVQPALDWLRDTFVTTLQAISVAIVTVAQGLALALATVFEALGGLIDTIVGGIGALLVNLAVNGVAAGAGAWNAATGITALAGALALLGGATLLSDIAAGIGGLFTSFTSFLTGTDTSAAGQIQAVAGALQGIANITQIEANWPQIVDDAIVFGSDIARGIIFGMQNSGADYASTIIGPLQGAIAQAQSQLDSNPLHVRVQVDQPDLSFANGLAAGMTTNINNKSFNVNTQNTDVARSLLNAWR